MVITYAFILATKIGRATLGIARVWAEVGRLCSGIISVKNNTNSVKNIILAITVVFLTPVFLNIHLPVPLKYASLHLKSKNMREKIEQSSLVKTALRSRCNIYHAPSLPNLACLLRQKKKEGTFKRLRISRYFQSKIDARHTGGSHDRERTWSLLAKMKFLIQLAPMIGY